jgi:hypothetical protein
VLCKLGLTIDFAEEPGPLLSLTLTKSGLQLTLRGVAPALLPLSGSSGSVAVCLPCVLCFRDGLVCLFRLCLGFIAFLLLFLGLYMFGFPGSGLWVFGVLALVSVSHFNLFPCCSPPSSAWLCSLFWSPSPGRFWSSYSFLLFQLGCLVSGAFRVLAG